MQDRYQSLDPERQDLQHRDDLLRMYRERLSESSGGRNASAAGYLFGTTAASMMYLRQERSGFKFLPLARHKSYQYAQLFFVGYFGFIVGHGLIAGVTSDISHQKYLTSNGSRILKGNAPFERPLAAQER